MRKDGLHSEIFRRFGRDPKIVFERDKWQCKICLSKKDLTIDHIDGNGRYSKKPNNDLNNLQTLCRSCHGKKDRARGWKWDELPEKSKRKMMKNLIWNKKGE